MDVSVLFSVMNEFIKCPRCGFSIESKLQMDGIGKQGLAIPIKIFCRSLSCKWNYIFYSSTLVGGAEASRSRGPKSFDINISSQIDFRKIGRGHDSIET